MVSPTKTAVRPRSSGCTASTGIGPDSAGYVASTVAPGRARSTRVQPSSGGQPEDFRRALRRGKEAGDVRKDGVMHAVGRQRRQERVGDLPDLPAAEHHRQHVAQRRAAVAARAEAVIAAQHDQSRPLANPFDEHLLLLRANDRNCRCRRK